MATAETFDFVIFGSGFGGSIMAMVLRRLGRSVLLLQRGAHPRFTIGESSTPFANLLLEGLAADYNLPFLRALSEWGTWQAQYPQIAGGLKRGFTFYHHTPGQPLDFLDRERQLLVAASPNDRVADTHWYRPDFDHFLVQQAQALGVTYLDHAQIVNCERDDGWRLRVNRHGTVRNFRASFAVDASGASGFLTEHLKLSSTNFAGFPKTRAVYAHFRNVARLDAFTNFGETPPYPPDDAAVHHVFDGGWIWVLRFNNGITSAGAALRSDSSVENNAPETIWRELLARFPSLAQQFARADAVTPFYSIPQLSFRRTQAAGDNWALLPSAVGFVDPLLSTGFALNLLGIVRLARAVSQRASDLREYAHDTFTELDAAADLISALYAKMNSSSEFASLSFLYFAALSYTEMAWRLGKEHLADSFLLSKNEAFTAARKHFCTAARAGEPIDPTAIAGAIEPWNIAGLAEAPRRNWYPVSFEHLTRSPQKLNASPAEIQRFSRKLELA